MSEDYGEDPVSGWATTEKDPDDIRWIPFYWAVELGADTIATSAFSLPDGLTNVSADKDDTQQSTRIKVSGGSCGNTYRVTNRITTTGGQTLDQTQYVKIREK